MRRWLLLPVLVPGLLLALAPPANACAALVGENGTIQLVRTTTLSAYHAGVEHYVTSFEFTGEGEQIGSIIPLPDVPTTVDRGGEWTLQRLAREVAPRDERVSSDFALNAAGESAEVILQTKIDALEITVLRGGADQVGEWALDHGFFLSPDAPEMLEFYAERSPIFMAARFDAATARDLGQTAGDGTPIHLTIPTDDAWVPLRILSLGLDSSQVVDADVFLLTDERPRLATGGPGLSLARSESASDLLLDDLRSDAGMEWVPESMWLSYLQLSAAAGDLDYDLGVSTDRLRAPSLTDVGVQRPEVRPVETGEAVPWVPIGAAIIAVAVLAVALTSTRRRQPA